MLFDPPTPVLLSVPHHQQKFTGDCLVACAMMVLDYHGLTFRYNRLVSLFQIKRPIGTPFSTIQELEKQRIRVIYKQHGTLAELYKYLTNDSPCIVDVATEELPYWQNMSTRHVVVITGMDNEHVYLNDLEFDKAPVRVTLGDFDLAWLQRDERYAVLLP